MTTTIKEEKSEGKYHQSRLTKCYQYDVCKSNHLPKHRLLMLDSCINRAKYSMVWKIDTLNALDFVYPYWKWWT